MARVKIKSEDNSQERKTLLLSILAKYLIYATRAIIVPDGFIILTRTDGDLDKILQGKTSEDLKSNNLHAVLPPELRAKRTVLVFNTDEYIHQHAEKEIEDELMDKNDWMKQGIENIFKIPRTKILKITFKDTAAANKAKDTGFLCFNMSIPPHAIKEEEYIPILTCMKCYSIEDHVTSKCPKPKEYKICSECSSLEHTWRECSITKKKCINCKGDHRTLANKCPYRKKVLDEKRQTKKENSSRSYATVANSNATMSTQNITQPIIDKDTTTNILSCMLHAHFMNAIHPGTYNEELNRALKLNNLPKINLPSNPPSKEILNLTSNTETQNTTNNNIPATEPTLEPTETATTEAPETQQTTEQEEQMPELEQIRGRGLGLQIITRKREGWPIDNTVSFETLKMGLETGQYKWRYTNTAYSEQEILKSLTNNEINLDNCWCTAEDSQFNKIRNGLYQQRTPPPSKVPKTTPRQRHSSK